MYKEHLKSNISWQDIVIQYNENVSKKTQLKIQKFLLKDSAESIFLYYAIWCGFPVLVELLFNAPSLQNDNDLKQICMIPKKYLIDYEKCFITPIEFAAQCGQYHMFQFLQKRIDVNYEKCFYWAQKMKNTDLVNYMIKNHLHK